MTAASSTAGPEVLSPLTGRADVTLIDTFPTPALISRWQDTYGLDVTREFHGLPEVRLYRCETTGLLFFRPAIAAGSAALYRGLQHAKAYYNGAMAWENFQALADLHRGWSVLEVGCGPGLFVQRASAAGIDIRGTELNPEAVAAAQSAGLPVECRDLSSFVNEGMERFDCVCAFQVLEHVPEPGAFLKEALSLVRPGGLLIVAVPNADGLLRGADELLDLPPHHMSRWTHSVFAALEPDYGVRLVRWRAEPLAASHVRHYLHYRRRQVTSPWTFGGLLPDAAPIAVADTLLRLGLRRFATGQSLYVSLEKVR